VPLMQVKVMTSRGNCRSLSLAAVLLAAVALLWLALSCAAFATASPDYTQVGHNITIGPNEQVSDLTCFGCSIRVRGQVAGDVTAFAGSVVIEDNAQVAGDVTVFGGDIRLDKAVKVAGSATVFGGQIRRDPQATISGDVTSMGGRVWLVPMLLFPFVILGLLIAFVIWLVQRMRGPSIPAAAA
jgi:cytoskeletal protein CcmA (bactofilin family)